LIFIYTSLILSKPMTQYIENIYMKLKGSFGSLRN